MKHTTLALSLLTLLSFNPAFAENEVNLPVISKPAVLEEGTQRTLSLSQIEELLPWAKDSKVFLNDLLDGVQGLSQVDRNERLIEGIQSVVGDSSSKNSELLMRYSLNRALVINKLLTTEMGGDTVGTIDAKNRVLVASIMMAIKYYEKDMAFLSNKTRSPYAAFGVDYFEFLSEINKSIFDASAQYLIQRTSLEWLQWDLYRDLNNTSFAAQIVKINNALKIYPAKKVSDAQAISYIRQMKSVTAQLKVKETLAKIDSDAALSLAKSENERREIIAKQKEAEEFKRMGPVIQVIQEIPMPSINKLYFSSTSNVDGVCKAMGYQKGLPGSIVNKDDARFSSASTLVVNDQGIITGAAQVTSRSGYGIEKVTCLNKVQNRPVYDVELVTVANIKNMMVNYKSDLNGVCKISGFQSAVAGSATNSDAIAGQALIFNKDGFPTGAEAVNSRSGYSITKLICMKKSRIDLGYELFNVNTSSYQGHLLSYKSNIDGICKAFNHEQGVPGSAVLFDRVTGKGLILDVTGNAIGTEDISSRSGYQVTSVACIDRK